MAFSLGVKGRGAQSADEREVLRKYAGFGGLKCILNDANELADAAKWSKSDIELLHQQLNCAGLSMIILRMTRSSPGTWIRSKRRC